MIESALTVIRRMVAGILLGAFMTVATTSMVLIPAEPAHAGFFDGIGDAIGGLVDDVVDVVDDVVDAATQLLNSIVDAITSIVNTLIDAVNGEINAIKAPIFGVLNAARDVITGVVNAFGDAIIGVVNAARNGINVAVDVSKNAITSVVNATGNAILSAVNGAPNEIIGAVDASGNAITGVVNAAKNAITGVVNTAKNAILNAVNASGNAITGVVNVAKNAITGVVNAVGNAILVAVNTVIDAVEEVHGFISNLVTLIVGLDPNNLHSFVVANLNEDACQTLPDTVNSSTSSLLPLFPDLPFIGDLVSFADLQLDLPDLTAIDPANADSQDLFLFETQTNLPIARLAKMAEFPYTIPSGIAAAFSSFCVEATEHHLAIKESQDELHHQLQHDLASGERGRATNAQNQLPAAQGGLLEEVRYLVFNTISRFEATGERLDKKVHREFVKGNAAFDAGSFREAHHHYQKAYSAIVRSHG